MEVGETHCEAAVTFRGKGQGKESIARGVARTADAPNVVLYDQTLASQSLELFLKLISNLHHHTWR